MKLGMDMDIALTIQAKERLQNMVRGCGKLKPFLISGLINNSYINLKFENENENVFYLKLPMNKKKDSVMKPYEKILVDWYDCNGRLSKYEGYSKAKAVIQAALNKNIYLITLDPIGDKKRYRFATTEETKEKKKFLKERAAKNGNRKFSFSSNPPSVASSGFYEEGDDMLAYNEEPYDDQMVVNTGLHEEEMRINDHVSEMDFGEIDFEVLDQWLDDNNNIYHAKVEEIKKDLEESSKNLFDQASENKVNDEALKITSLDVIALVQQPAPESLLNQVGDLNPSPVVASKPVQNQQRTYWLCIHQQKVGAILMLIWEKRDIETGVESMQEGSLTLCIPDNVLEPGTCYMMEKFFQIDKYCFGFLLPSPFRI